MANRVIENTARTLLIEKLEMALERAYQDFMGQNKMPTFICDEGEYHDVVRKIAYKQAGLSVEELIAEYPDLSEENINNRVTEYVLENFDQDFLMSSIDQELNKDSIRNRLVNNIVLILYNMEPYGKAPAGYWLEQVKKIQTIEELGGYIEEANYDELVEEYAEDWQDVLSEI